MRILRRDIKKINIKIDHKKIPDIPYKFHLYNGTYLSIESYMFKITRVSKNNKLSNKALLRNTTEKTVREFRDLKRYLRNEILFTKTQLNIPTSTYANGEIINANSNNWDVIDLTLSD